MKKITIKEIAKMANVSVTAVSFVLNNRSGVSDATRKKVRKIIAETGFKPNLTSKKLLLNKSFNICIVINSFSSPFEDLFYFEVTRGILNRSIKYNYNITIAKPSFSTNELPDIVYSRDTDGIIFMQDINKELMEKAASCGVPSVIVDSHSCNEKITSITPNYRKATYDATKYLVEHGHREIAIIASETVHDFYNQTLEGFKDAMQECGITFCSDFFITSAYNEATAYKAAEKILKGNKIPTAFVCTVDSFAIGAMRCAKDLNFALPQDISFIGIDDILLSRYIEPKLTTIGIDKVKMGEMAMDILLSKIKGKNPESVLLPMELIIRDSVYNLNK